MKDEFVMMQFSIYTRHCASEESTEVHMKRVREAVPQKGHVSILKVTDKQYGDILNFFGATEQLLPPAPTQLELF
ncbi:CRISPR-associated endonuclease Cas2 [Chitinophaga nivalis]|uniref:CRISPR-associated endonuclease Cas2 n=1 Tax=Chitinophaga nivalis TaxID=2991709 RepID=A0ABT3IF20_9BACT|nr:CRISPR-associated endonuclease Cas2 [Chitinophaga nivalis]MCW3482553.1 CRISPR-associated endonuclease Cas2 [Chitinophaga nivalis]